MKARSCWIPMFLGLSLLVGSAVVATPAARVPTWDPPSSTTVADALMGLPFDEFIETSYTLYLLRYPEAVSRMGMADAFGVRNDRLNDYSQEYVQETQAIERTILGLLRDYDRSTLAASQRLTYDVCEWYWADVVLGQAFADHDYPVTHFFVTSLPLVVLDLLTDEHPLRTRADVEDYLTRLQQIGRQFDQVIEGLVRRADAGIVAPKAVIDQTLSSLRGLALGLPRTNPYYTTLEQRLGSIADLGPGEVTALRDEAEATVRDVVIPAYQRLYDQMQWLRADAPTEIGVGHLPEGDACYAYLVQHFTGTGLTPEEIHQLGLREVDRVTTEVVDAASELGYPEGLSVADVFRRAEEDGESVSGSAILRAYEALVEQAKRGAFHAFSALPQTPINVVTDEVGGYYSAAPRDGSRPAEFVAPAGGTQPRFSMPTLTYHETIPGHHLQIATAQELDLPLLQSEEVFLGFSEGWAVYAERLAWELGWYAADPYGNIGRLRDEMMRAARLVVDTGIHAKGWSFDEAVSYYQQMTGKSAGHAEYDIYRYAVWPGQAVSYMVGYLEILDLRETVQDALGEGFDLTEFHEVVLESGNVPLSLIEEIIEEYSRQYDAP